MCWNNHHDVLATFQKEILDESLFDWMFDFGMLGLLVVAKPQREHLVHCYWSNNRKYAF